MREVDNIRRTGLKLKDKSTQSKSEYLFDHILYGSILAYDIYNILPVVVPIAKYYNSVSKLIGCMLFTSIFGIIFSYNYNRCGKGVFQNIVSGLGLYIVFTVGRYVPIFIRCLGVAMLVISIAGIVCVVSKRIKRTNKRKKIVLLKFLRCMQIVRRNLGVAGAIAVIVLPIGLHYFPNDKLNADYYVKVCEEHGLNVEDIQDENEISEYEED